MATTLFSFLSFIGKTGIQPVDSQDLNLLAGWTVGARDSITALAGGAQATAPVLSYGTNSLDTVATTNDSVQLPSAVAGARVTLSNDGANTAKVYANASPNGSNAGAVDVIRANATTANTANGTAVTLASGYTAEFVCATTGIWKWLYAAS